MKRGQVAVDHPIVQKKIDGGLKLSIQEGGVASISSAFSLSYFSAAALAIGANSVQMGILHSLTLLVQNIAQLRTASLIRNFSRRVVTNIGVLMKLFLVLFFLLVGYLHWIGVPHMVWAFIGIVSLHCLATAISYPAWFSWMGSIVPEEKRGSYFSKRNRVVGLWGIIAMVAGALLLDFIELKWGTTLGVVLIGFGILFILSGVFRLWSYELLRVIYEPRIKIKKKDGFSLHHFLKHIRETPFGKFTIFAGGFAFAVGISSPYWVVYMLRDLGMSYSWYMAITVSSPLFQLVFLPVLGKFGDRFGNIKLIRMCSFLIATVPFLWVASALLDGDLATKFYLLLVPSVVGGFSWAGYNLALSNYVYDAVDGDKRGKGLSYMNLMIGIGGFLGSIVGAILAWVDVSFMNSMLFIFSISGVMRLVMSFYAFKNLYEVRHVKRFSSKFWVKEFGPAQTTVREFRQFGTLVDKVEHFVDEKDLVDGKVPEAQFL